MSGKPKEGYQWMADVDTATPPDQVSDPKGKDTLDLKVSAAYSRILRGELGSHMCLLEQKAEVAEQILSGREIAWHVEDFSRLSAKHGAVLEFRDLIETELRNNNLKQFMLDWESILTRSNKLPAYEIFEYLFLDS